MGFRPVKTSRELKMHKLVLIRHGQSTWNLENRFTGWTDVDLSAQGLVEAQKAGDVLRCGGYTFDTAFTSVLKRAIKTLWSVMSELNLEWIPVIRAWELNERHYGSLQGLNKADTAARFGDEQVLIWRRSFSITPPGLGENDERHPRFDRRYDRLTPVELPATESLKLTLGRVWPYWDQKIAPVVKSGKRVVIVAHGNSLRALVKYLDKLSEEEVVELNIPTGVPLVYELDNNLKPIRHYYIGNSEEIAKAEAAVANQGKSR